jgi:hypothetical protein
MLRKAVMPARSAVTAGSAGAPSGNWPASSHQRRVASQPILRPSDEVQPPHYLRPLSLPYAYAAKTTAATITSPPTISGNMLLLPQH